jgi:alkylated DNA repair dioxygenase AlkB
LNKQAAALPAGFEYRPGLLDASAERDLVAAIQTLRFQNFDFHGYQGRRRVVYFGWKYEFGPGGLQKADEIPPFLLRLRDRAASFARLYPAQLPHALVTEYAPGAPIGWHRDKPVFGDVVGISLYSPCTLRFRKKCADGWQRASISLEPRSAYLLRGHARTEWEHSIPPVHALRYSITFRTLRSPPTTHNGT